MSLKYLLTNDLLFKCATDLPPGACNIQLLGMVCFVDQNNQLSNHRAYLESHGAKFVFLKFMLDMSIKIHGGQDAIRLEFKHSSLAIYFCFVDLQTYRYCITRKIACYNCLPVSWPAFQLSHTVWVKDYGNYLHLLLYYLLSGAIIGDGDRKRAPFLVLGLAPWDGTIFLFLFRTNCAIACGIRATYACCDDFWGCRAGEIASEIQEIFYAFGPQLNTFMSVGIWLKYFRRKLHQCEWSNAVSNLGMFSFILLTKLCSATSFYTRTSHFSTLAFTIVED